MSNYQKQVIDLEEQIERCHRLAEGLTDEEMRSALEELAAEYERQLKLRKRRGAGFMLQPGSGSEP